MFVVDNLGKFSNYNTHYIYARVVWQSTHTSYEGEGWDGKREKEGQ